MDFRFALAWHRISVAFAVENRHYPSSQFHQTTSLAAKKKPAQGRLRRARKALNQLTPVVVTVNISRVTVILHRAVARPIDRTRSLLILTFLIPAPVSITMTVTVSVSIRTFIVNRLWCNINRSRPYEQRTLLVVNRGRLRINRLRLHVNGLGLNVHRLGLLINLPVIAYI